MTKMGALDGKTLALLAAIVTGAPLLVWLHSGGYLPFWAAAVIGTCLMNFTFAIWHETSHANFAKSVSLNHVAGVLASLYSIYPGYFARRREHLAHHKWEGNEQLDPVYPRIQGSALNFFFRLTWLTIKRENRIESKFMPLTESQKRWDRLTIGVSTLLVGLSLRFNFFTSVLAVFILPRLAIFYLHAFYICYLPHAKPEGGFEKYRVSQNSSLWWRAFTAGQWAHGVHHRWPNLRWHQYAAHIKRLEQGDSA